MENISNISNTSTAFIWCGDLLDDFDVSMYLAIEEGVAWFQLLVTIASFLLNLTVLWACSSKTFVFKHKLLIQYLSTSDLVYSISETMYIHRRFNHHEWVFGDVLCHLSVLPHVSIAFSIFIVLFIAWDRYRSIVYPFRSEIAERKKRIIIGVLAFGAISLYIPSIFSLKVVEYYGKKDCVRDLDVSIAQYWDVMIFIVLLPLPAIIIVLCYTKIIRKVQKSFEFISKNSANANDNICKHDKQILLMLVIIVFVFVITSLPNHTLVLWVIFARKENPIQDRKVYLTLYWISSLIHLHSLINPIIYMISDPRFQVVFKNFLKNLFGFKKKRQNSQKINIVVKVDNFKDDSNSNCGSIQKLKNLKTNHLHPHSAYLTKQKHSQYTEQFTMNTSSRSHKSHQQSVKCSKVEWVSDLLQETKV